MGDEDTWFRSDGGITSDFNQVPTGSPSAQRRGNPDEGQSSGLGIEGLIDDSTIQGRIAREVYGRGKERAQGFVNVYTNIDLVRPYFDVDPKEVAYRLLFSLIPYRTRSKVQPELPFESPLTSEGAKKPDLYGPLMLCFTLASILLLGIKLQIQGESQNSTTRLQEGTLLSTALLVSFCYWSISSIFYYFLSFMFNGELSFLQILSFVGYAQFGVCISLLVHCFISGWVDLTVMIIVGGAAAIVLALELWRRTPHIKHAVVISGAAFVLQLCFLIYLQVFYTAISRAELEGSVNEMIGNIKL